MSGCQLVPNYVCLKPFYRRSLVKLNSGKGAADVSLLAPPAKYVFDCSTAASRRCVYPMVYPPTPPLVYRVLPSLVLLAAYSSCFSLLPPLTAIHSPPLPRVSRRPVATPRTPHTRGRRIPRLTTTHPPSLPPRSVVSNSPYRCLWFLHGGRALPAAELRSWWGRLPTAERRGCELAAAPKGLPPEALEGTNWVRPGGGRW